MKRDVIFLTCENFNKGRETEKVGLVGIVGNLFLFLIKIFIAVLSKSQALLADSVNSATDILSSIMTYVGGKISQNASDENHNYGYGKAEYVFSLLISVVMGGATSKERNQDTSTLLDYGFNNYKSVTLYSKNEVCNSFNDFTSLS